VTGWGRTTQLRLKFRIANCSGRRGANAEAARAANLSV
jgi:hypothetical protein